MKTKSYPIDSTFTVKDLMQVLEDMDSSGTVYLAASEKMRIFIRRG